MGVQILNFFNKIKTVSFFILIVFCLDRILKYLAIAGKIFYFKNTGIAFSVPLSQNLILYFNILISLILIFLIYLLIKFLEQKNNLLFVLSFELLIIGTVSNLIDRIKFGFVIDYFNFGFFYNNLADIFIIAGLLILFWKLIFKNNFDKK